jgi:hypothetical protein
VIAKPVSEHGSTISDRQSIDELRTHLSNSNACGTQNKISGLASLSLEP